jgi:hypothetical protein
MTPAPEAAMPVDRTDVPRVLCVADEPLVLAALSDSVRRLSAFVL